MLWSPEWGANQLPGHRLSASHSTALVAKAKPDSLSLELLSISGASSKNVLTHAAEWFRSFDIHLKTTCSWAAVSVSERISEAPGKTLRSWTAMWGMSMKGAESTKRPPGKSGSKVSKVSWNIQPELGSLLETFKPIRLDHQAGPNPLLAWTHTAALESM